MPYVMIKVLTITLTNDIVKFKQLGPDYQKNSGRVNEINITYKTIHNLNRKASWEKYFLSGDSLLL